MEFRGRGCERRGKSWKNKKFSKLKEIILDAMGVVCYTLQFFLIFFGDAVKWLIVVIRPVMKLLWHFLVVWDKHNFWLSLFNNRNSEGLRVPPTCTPSPSSKMSRIEGVNVRQWCLTKDSQPCSVALNTAVKSPQRASRRVKGFTNPLDSDPVPYGKTKEVLIAGVEKVYAIPPRNLPSSLLRSLQS